MLYLADGIFILTHVKYVNNFALILKGSILHVHESCL